VASALQFGAVGEAAVFAAASVASLALIRPAVLAHLYRRSDAGPTGVAKLIGRTAVAVDAVTAESGSVIIDGDTWSARTEQGTIAAGQPARITAITGAIARVTPA
jgi:membrane protein implicated in regulation of membrane protease activity